MKTKNLLATVLIAALILVSAGCNNQSVTIIPEDGNENKESSIEIIQSDSIAETTIKSTATVTPTPIICVSETTVDNKSTNHSSESTQNDDVSVGGSSSVDDENDNTQTGSLPNQESIEDDSSSGTITSGNNTRAASTPVPTATPIPEPTEPEPDPTEKEPVAAIVQVTEIVYGSDDPDGEGNAVSVTVIREYTVQPKPGTVYRLVKSLSGTNSFSYESCRPDSLGSVNSLTNGLVNLPIYVDDRVAFAPDYLQKRLDLFLADNIDVGLVIIDYLELIISRDLDDASKQKKRAEISNSLKLIAEKYNVAIVILSTVWWSDDAEKYAPVPSCAVLKDSPIAQDSDSVIFIHRPVYYEIEDYVAQDKAIPQIQDVQLIVAKNGHGKSDVTINAKWDRSRLSYFETGTSEE